MRTKGTTYSETGDAVPSGIALLTRDGETNANGRALLIMRAEGMDRDRHSRRVHRFAHARRVAPERHNRTSVPIARGSRGRGPLAFASPSVQKAATRKPTMAWGVTGTTHIDRCFLVETKTNLCCHRQTSGGVVVVGTRVDETTTDRQYDHT
jgi:hypothetical protein